MLKPHLSPLIAARGPRLARDAALAVFVALMMATAWLGDDCLISLRTVANAVSGHGLVWNPGERVQAFTHPLWVLVLLPLVAVTRELYSTTLGTTALLSVMAVGLVARRSAGSVAGGAVAVLGLTFSRAFVDYSTSGLENPLTHLLLAVALACSFNDPASEQKVQRLSVLLGLAITTRHDNLLLFSPLLASAMLERPTRGALARSLVGLVVPALWTLFSLWYYGFPFPNTAYAKLGTGIAPLDRIQQGLYYLTWTAWHDPVTLALVALATAATLRRRDRAMLAPLVGIGLHLLYVVWIGGDFMGGRFLSGVALASAVLVGRSVEILDRRALRLAVGMATLALVGLGASRLEGANDVTSGGGPLVWQGITDERAYYTQRLGLLRGLHPTLARAPLGTAPRWTEGSVDRVAADVSLGMTGLTARPGTWYIDPVALADPLLARLPMWDRGRWRPGHFLRVIPEGYPETILSGVNQIRDPKLAELYDHLQVVVRGDLDAPGRLDEIIAFNLGRYAHLIDVERYRHPAVTHLPAATLDDPEGADRQLGRFGAMGAVIELDQDQTAEAIVLGLSARHRYRVQFLNGDQPLGPRVTVEPSEPGGVGVALSRIVVPAIAHEGFDRVELQPDMKCSDQQFQVTWLEVIPQGRASAAGARRRDDSIGEVAADQRRRHHAKR